MKKIKLTRTQKEIIESVNGSIVVSASAGTGKTGVLVEKIKYELENIKIPNDADCKRIHDYLTN